MARRKTRRKLGTGLRHPQKPSVCAAKSSGKNAKTTARAPVSGKRAWVFRILAALLGPVVFLLLAEAALWAVDYGYPSAFFVPSDTEGALTTNHWFIWFYRRARTTSPHPCLIQAVKPDESLRVFVLGESAAMGTPDPAFSLGRILEIMLQRQFPDHDIEVVNAAVRGIDSHIVTRISRDCARWEPDLFVVYMGNNDVIGKYGTDSFLSQHPGLIAPMQRVQRARVFQGIRAAVERVSPSDEDPKQAETMDVFHKSRVALDDPRRQAVYGNYRRNLTQICDNARAAGAGVVVATVPVNLRDFPPLASLHRQNLDPAALERWKTLYDGAIQYESRQQWAEAIAGFKKAEAIDDRYADLHFRLARCYLAAGDVAAAKDHFSRARDHDALQFRMDSRMNEIVRETVAGYADESVQLADLEADLASGPLCPNGLPGNEMFYDQVHYTFDGGYELARLMLPAVTEVLVQKRELSPAESAQVPSRDECASRLAFTPWDQIQAKASIGRMLARPPFLDQIDRAQRQAQIERAVSEARGRIDESFVDNVVKSYEEAIALAPSDWVIRYNYADFLYQLKRYQQAVPHIHYVVRQFGDIATFRVLLGYCLAGSGRIDRGIEQLQQAHRLDKHSKPVKEALASTLRLKQQVGRRAQN